ncbi:capsular biosynthesis protein [Endozoicomonas sp. GU-1]|uniref:capsular biosynthesis protein n=1 Tax=Endozoicomonas sp. GU-1 TaxID=3009078 RepID=UPI0022B2CA3B|nr:capsular biosynthesis protein [Endozoicomonas sp. GU-1]WBA85838.1 capsular biosynthesis protein [Endozoicomonas sp. GU-1]
MDYLQRHSIESVFLLGDCRFYHRTAKPVCERLGVRFLVFEEGYLRPDTITLEEHGVNAFSQLALSLEDLAGVNTHACSSKAAMGGTMAARTRFAAAYYWAAWFARRRFARYCHHRAFQPVVEGAKWLRGFARKGLYRFQDQKVEQSMRAELSQRFFMVALQVHDDSQMLYHSSYGSVTAFIEEVIHSFASYGPEQTVLVLKHHPMDRGYTHYGRVIRELAERLGISHRVIYCHDLRLPSIYSHCLGVVTVNSTVGPSALLHKIPVKVMGRAIYDIPGLTSQCTLNDFWQYAEPVDIDRFHQFQTLLFDKTQINGSFFTRLDITCANVLTFYEQHFLRRAPVVLLLDEQPVDHLLDEPQVA